MSKASKAAFSQRIRQNRADSRKEAKKENAALEKQERKELSKAQLLFQGQLNPKKLQAKRPVRLEQWVEVRIVDGKPQTTLYPSNELVIKRGQKLWPPPTIVYRRLNFPDGIPPEYEWTGVQDEHHRKYGGCGIQRMPIETWLETIVVEANRIDGHINPVPCLPRPRECGECPCATCQRKYKIMDEAAARERRSAA